MNGKTYTANNTMPAIQKTQKKALPAVGNFGSGPMWLNVISGAVSTKVIRHG